jgi:hypothetical protein
MLRFISIPDISKLKVKLEFPAKFWLNNRLKLVERPPWESRFQSNQPFLKASLQLFNDFLVMKDLIFLPACTYVQRGSKFCFVVVGLVVLVVVLGDTLIKLQWQDTKLQWQDTELQWQDTKLR